MARSKSSGRWLQEHHSDHYVKKAREQGLRSRAVFKLAELDRGERLFHPGQVVVDLGAAPGGWSQYAVERIGDRGLVVALDLLDMATLPNTVFIRGDFTEKSVYEQLIDSLPEARADLVMSDMAPNMSGNKQVDLPRAMYLAELARDMALDCLNPDGVFLVKVFHGEGFDDLLRSLRLSFRKVQVRKPDASRARSRETYLLARGLLESASEPTT